ncbi:unnamed protein product [Heligmosomoides polygyrus]|uniref:Nuclear receptor domain-containing protein n=1 Tax=Heligmosomoides polygyrus TaxID=6339 RepID=A0A183GBL5_HELPZ|nr:unnamed protein product [Heligmosomoides polygyrus]
MSNLILDLKQIKNIKLKLCMRCCDVVFSSFMFFFCVRIPILCRLYTAHVSAGRNVCRSCRFQKCLDVGMEPDAIRPDRDKTGRQKNPRRNAVVKKLSGASMFGDLPCVNKRFQEDSDESPTSPSSRAESAPVVDIRPSPCDEILTTLREIEQICLQLRDVAPVSPMTRPTLLDCVHRPSLITPRSQVSSAGSQSVGVTTHRLTQPKAGCCSLRPGNPISNSCDRQVRGLRVNWARESYRNSLHFSVGIKNVSRLPSR